MTLHDDRDDRTVIPQEILRQAGEVTVVLPDGGRIDHQVPAGRLDVVTGRVIRYRAAGGEEPGEMWAGPAGGTALQEEVAVGLCAGDRTDDTDDLGRNCEANEMTLDRGKTMKLLP